MVFIEVGIEIALYNLISHLDINKYKIYVTYTDKNAFEILEKKIANYYEYINGLKDEECNDALYRIFPKINLEEINKIIDETVFISNVRKEFYKKIIQMRYEKILKCSYEKLRDFK